MSIDTPTQQVVTGSLRGQADDGVKLSKHALDRWDERTPNHSVSPETALERSFEASEVSEDISTEEAHHSRVRVYAGVDYVAIFLIADTYREPDVVTTVLSVRMLNKHPEVQRYLYHRTHVLRMLRGGDR